IKSSDFIRRFYIRTTLIVFFNSNMEKWQAIETTFLKYYYVPDPKDMQTKYFIGSSKAEYLHEEVGRQGDKILMTGHPTEGQCGLEDEPLLGDPELIGKIMKTVKAEINYMKSKFPDSRTEWSLDKSGNLIKEEWYEDKDPSKPEQIERFIRH